MEKFYTNARGEVQRELASSKPASQRQAARSESPPVRCFQVDREILTAASM
jgi:hypothetical protein